MAYPPEKRSFYRIHYNAATCPFFKFQAHGFEVVDLSEEGFRFSLISTKGLVVEMEVTGSLNFRDGESFLVHGTIMRVTANEATVKLKQSFSLRKIMSEQRRLIQSDNVKKTANEK